MNSLALVVAQEEEEGKEGKEGNELKEEQDDDHVVIAAPAATYSEPAVAAAVAQIDEEEDYEYEYEEDDGAFSGFLDTSTPVVVTKSELLLSSSTANSTTNNNKTTTATVVEEEPKWPKWRQPSKEAVSMSLRAEQETTGGKRRLAQDLYRIMNQNHEQAGFSLQPAQEDCMKTWTLKLDSFDQDSNLAKDLAVLGLQYVELEMSFPDQYPFEPPFCRVVRPRFKRQTGFVMNGALCMELLTKDGWNPVNDIESVIVSIRSLLVVGDGRLEAAYDMTDKRYATLLEQAQAAKPQANEDDLTNKNSTSSTEELKEPIAKRQRVGGGSYTTSEAEAAYTHLSDYHKKKGWDTSGWWARKG